jgi:hypothetical protein
MRHGGPWYIAGSSSVVCEANSVKCSHVPSELTAPPVSGPSRNRAHFCRRTSPVTYVARGCGVALKELRGPDGRGRLLPNESSAVGLCDTQSG